MVELVQADHVLRIETNADGTTPVTLGVGTGAQWRAAAPIEIEVDDGETRVSLTAGYQHITAIAVGVRATATVTVGGAELHITDEWRRGAAFFSLKRRCEVTRPGVGGFLTRLRLRNQQPQAAATRIFVPGMIYGGPEHLTPAASGGADTWRRGGAFTVLIREDRMPAPLVAAYVADGVHLTCFDADPTGTAPLEDSRDLEGQVLFVDGMGLNALGFQGDGDAFDVLACSPANEGEVTYRGTTYPGGQRRAWRRRYQTLDRGQALTCTLGLRLSAEPSFPELATHAWRAVFTHLNPHAPHEDLEQVTDVLIQRLLSQVADIPGPDGSSGRGLANYVDAFTKASIYAEHNNAIIGFTGRNLEVANVLLRWADDHPDERGALARREGEAIIAGMLRLKLDPPEAEGYSLVTGAPALAIAHTERVFLRSFSDDLKVLARAYLREQAAGRAHPDWRAWLESFGRWLLGQQGPDGSFPRAWRPGSGAVADPSPWSSYNPIPLLAHLHTITGDDRYLRAALAAGDFCWRSGQHNFRFIGGTIDNPDILDKEAGTLSLEAYLALHTATRDPRWLSRADMAARFAETWMYVWNVPIAPDEDDAAVHWKKGLPTIGLQLIASGHSLVDMYMAFDADDYARLFALSGERHYLDVARLLLHGTKTMLSLPGRLFDLGEPGWQQEHWSLAPPRGYGLHRGWLPWLATSHLAAIYDLKDFDPALYATLQG